MNKTAPRKTALLGIFCAEALAVSFLESLIPQFVPVPGIKPGFSNIVTMFCLHSLGFSYAVGVTLFKAFFALLTRGITASLLSLSGGLLSLVIMFILIKFTKRPGYIGIGVCGAVFHNAGQLAAAVVILGKSILNITPVLLIGGVITGIITGTVFKYTIPVLEKQTTAILKRRSSERGR